MNGGAVEVAATRVLRIDSGIARWPLHGVAATRQIETAALAAGEPHALMRAAGAAVARLALALAPHARSTWVFAGPGNNGGDGIEAALALHGLGRRVVVVVVGDANGRPADAADACRRAQASGVETRSLPSISGDAGCDPPDLVIDALLGIGGTRAPADEFADAVTLINGLGRTGVPVLAVDVPSGLDADRGQPLGEACIVASDTLSLLTLKPGLSTGLGGDHAGRLWFAPLIDEMTWPVAPGAWLVGATDPSVRIVARRSSQHKGSFGDVAVVGGAPGMRGAGWLAARAAQAAGAGRVFVDALDADAGGGIDPMHPELMFRPGWWQSAAAAEERAVVVCGCGGGDSVVAALPRLLSVARRLVLDADALNAIARDSGLQVQLAAREGRGHATVLTPHPLEAARLLGSTVDDVQADRLRAAQGLADRFRCVALVKGAGTVIAALDRLPRINGTGNASLATAGTGDVLAGWLGGRWAASGLPRQSDAAAATSNPPGAVAGGDAAFDVATRAVIEHGLAAEPALAGALRASDLVEALYRIARREAAL